MSLPSVIIGYSRQFQSKSLFNDKVSRVLSTLSDYEIIAIGDPHNLIGDLYPGKVSKIIDYNIKPSEIKKIIAQSEYAVFFWDGDDISEFIYYSQLLHKKTRIIAVETTKVANKDSGNRYDVYIGRGSPWGNPFAIGDNGMTREDVIEKYKEYFNEKYLKDEQSKKVLEGLRGKILGCHCKPAACHGDVIADYLNSTI